MSARTDREAPTVLGAKDRAHRVRALAPSPLPLSHPTRSPSSPPRDHPTVLHSPVRPVPHRPAAPGRPPHPSLNVPTDHRSDLATGNSRSPAATIATCAATTPPHEHRSPSHSTQPTRSNPRPRTSPVPNRPRHRHHISHRRHHAPTTALPGRPSLCDEPAVQTHPSAACATSAVHDPGVTAHRRRTPPAQHRPRNPSHPQPRPHSTQAPHTPTPAMRDPGLTARIHPRPAGTRSAVLPSHPARRRS